jgi:hypothetical protein
MPLSLKSWIVCHLDSFWGHYSRYVGFTSVNFRIACDAGGIGNTGLIFEVESAA